MNSSYEIHPAASEELKVYFNTRMSGFCFRVASFIQSKTITFIGRKTETSTKNR